MDKFFDLFNTSRGNDILWFEEPIRLPMVMNRGAFSRYTSQTIGGLALIRGSNGSNHTNINKKMIEFLKKSWVRPVYVETIESDTDQSDKHRINERMRREKHKQSYLALHKILPIGTKSEKNFILKTAAKEIEELQKLKEELRRKNREMAMSLSTRAKQKPIFEKAEIKLKVAYPTSGIDSMIEVLKCLKQTGSTATAIQSDFSQQEFNAVLELQTKIRAAEVEKAVQRALLEAESKFHRRYCEKKGNNGNRI